MMREQMKGSQRNLLVQAVDELAKKTKDVRKKLDLAFLPTLHADAQAERLVEAKKLIPPVDDVGRKWEHSQFLNAVYRNAIVVFARRVDKIRDNEKDATISTSDSDALIEDLQSMIENFGDERTIENILDSERNGEGVEKNRDKPDPAQIDFTKEGAKE